MRLGFYELGAEIGRGGMAAVHRARDVRTGAEVAVKVLPALAARDTEAVARFEREARAARAIEHGSVARCLDAGVEGGTRFLVFELLRGGNLEERLHREGRLPWREAVRLAAGVARGLEALHEAGVVHRDVKPANVLLDEEGAPRLADFGLVQLEAARESLTATGAVVGTPHYLSPEQADGKPVTPLADLHGLGALLHALLTGEPPFKGDGFALLRKVIAEPPPSVRARAPDVPPAVAEFVARLLSKDPGARGTSAGRVAAELEALLAKGAPRRGRGRAVAAFALGGVATLLALFYLWLVMRPVPAPPPPGPASRTPAVPPPPAPPVKPRGDGLAVLATWGAPTLCHAAEIEAAAWISSDRFLAAGSDGELLVWDVVRARSEPLRPRGDPVCSMAVEAGIAALGARGGGVELVDLKTRSFRPWKTKGKDPRVALTRDGAFFAFTSGPAELTLFDRRADSGLSYGLPLDGRPITAIAFGGDGSLAVLARDRLLLDATKPMFGNDAVTLATEGCSLAVARDGSRVAIGDRAGWIRIFEKGAIRFEWQAHPGFAVLALGFGRTRDELVSASVDPTYRRGSFWTCTRGEWTARALVGPAGAEFTEAAFSPDGRRIALVNSDRSIAVFDRATLADLHPTTAHRARVSAIAVSEDGEHVLSAGHDRQAKLWSPRTGDLEIPKLPPDGTPFEAVAFGQGTTRALLALASGYVKVVEAGTEIFGSVPREGTFIVGTQRFAMTPGGPNRIFEARGQQVLATNVETGAATPVLSLADRVASLAYAPPRTLLATDERGRLTFFDTETGKSSAIDDARARLVAASADGTVAISGAQADSLSLWDPAARAQLGAIAVAPGALTALAFASSDGSAFVVATQDGKVRLVDRKTLDELGTLDLGPEQDAVTAIAHGTLDGRPVLYLGSARGLVRKVALALGR